jgi:hypothetical protein
MEMKKWSSKVKRVINEEGRRKGINRTIVSANTMLVLVRELPIYSERWLGCQKPSLVRMRRRIRRSNMTNRTYIAVFAVFKTIQSKALFQIL